jgi:ferredoxin
MAKLMRKEKISELLAKLSGYDVYAPVLVEGSVSFQKIEKGMHPAMEYRQAQRPPKSVFFPQTEKMFDLVREGQRFVDIKEAATENKPIAVLGIRPCDARAAAMLDKVFGWDYDDPYYQDKRNRATVIALACTLPKMPHANCFCTSIGGNPASTEGVDVLLTEINDSYLVESVTDKGNKLVEAAGPIFTEAGDTDMQQAAKAKQNAEAAIVKKMNLDGVKEALQNCFESDYWKEFSDRCLGCGICTLLCPTCHCFDISDVISHGKGRRERTWDSCQFEYYSVHASGHNPRPAKKHRQRNRIYHKFLYMDENLGVIGCVGCGRCTARCPVNIDIVEVVEGAKGAGK